MQFIRSYNNNLIDKDRYSSRKKEYDSLESEIFENISKIIIHTETHKYEFTDKDTEKVVESYNYFTCISKSNNGVNPTKILIIKYNLVEKIELITTP